MAWTTLRDPRTAHSGTYHADTLARLTRAVMRRIPAARAAMWTCDVSIRITGSIAGEDPMAPEVAWVDAAGSRQTASAEALALLAKLRDAHGLRDPSGRTLVIESWEAPRSGRQKRREERAERATAAADEAMLAAFEAEDAR